MRAITVTEPGGPAVLVLSDVPDPEPAPGEVVIEVAAAGLNRADLMQRQGFYPPPAGAPPYPGLECAGRIAALSAGVTGWRVGDEACALLAGGGYAELVAVPAGQLLPLPEGISIHNAAALPEAACTVYSNVVQLCHLTAGETLLIHGGASGIGTFAIQLARALGARVACTAGSKAKLERCRALGAERAIDYTSEDFVVAIGEFTEGRGADVILDIVGAAYLERNVQALAADGRLVIIGMQGGARADFDISALFRRRGSVHATTLRARPADQKAAIVAAVREHVWPLVAAGQIRPVIADVLPLAEASRAHELMEAGQHVGKILLTV
jgi:putative PIG3 family NAD(P)H quinone oxidoreductase